MPDQTVSPPLVPDWARIIADLSGAGYGSRELSRIMQMQITDRMIRWYGDGMQPAYWRGKLVIDAWCDALRRRADDVPLIPLKRGYRDQGQYARDPGARDPGPKVTAPLPQWPPAPAKRKGGRPRRPEVVA